MGICQDNGLIKYWKENSQESMDRCTGCCNITEILLKMVLNIVEQQLPIPDKKVLDSSVLKSFRDKMYLSKGRKHKRKKIKRMILILIVW